MQTEVILIVGKRGTGKTTWARDFIQDKTRVIVAEAGYGEFGVKTVDNFPDLVEEVRRGFFRVSYTPRSHEWPAFLELCIEAGRVGGPLWVVLEEARRIPRHIPEYEEVNIQGRHYGLNLVAMSTRAAHLPPDYRSQATRVIAFRQKEPADLDYLREVIGDRADDLPALPGHDHIEWREEDDWKPLKNTPSDSEPSSKEPLETSTDS